MLKLKQVKLAMQEDHTYGKDGEQESGRTLLREECSFEYEGHKFDHEEQYGGEEMGSEYWIVFSVTNLAEAKDVAYYKVPGFYQSHYGSELEWGSLFEVKQQKKTITVWEQTK